MAKMGLVTVQGYYRRKCRNLSTSRQSLRTTEASTFVQRAMSHTFEVLFYFAVTRILRVKIGAQNITTRGVVLTPCRARTVSSQSTSSPAASFESAIDDDISCLLPVTSSSGVDRSLPDLVVS